MIASETIDEVVFKALEKKQNVIEQVIKAADEFKRPVIACLGLAFKADIDDLRESPALQIVQALAANNIGELLVVEPNISILPEALVKQGLELTSISTALEKANVIVVLVDHKQFKAADRSQFATKVVIDTRGIL